MRNVHAPVLYVTDIYSVLRNFYNYVDGSECSVYHCMHSFIFFKKLRGQLRTPFA